MMERLKFLEKQREEEDKRNALDETQKEELEQYEEALRQQLVRVAEQAQETEKLIEKAIEKKEMLTEEQQKVYEDLEEKWEAEHALRQQRIRSHEQQLKALRTSLDLVRAQPPHTPASQRHAPPAALMHPRLLPVFQAPSLVSLSSLFSLYFHTFTFSLGGVTYVSLHVR